MPDQLDIVIQRMIDAGESEEDIAAVIQDFKDNPSSPKQEAIPPTKQVITEPTDWGSGVMKSITSGEAGMAGLRGAGGYIRGALADLPSSIWGTAKLAESLTPSGAMRSLIKGEPHPLQNAWEGIKQLPEHIVGTYERAGSQPHEFGRMMGQMTGQPALLEAGIPRVPSAVRKTGGGVEATGAFVKKNTPVTGVFPPMLTPRTARLTERFGGSVLEKIGQRMKGWQPSSANLEKIEGNTTTSVNTSTSFKPGAPVSPDPVFSRFEVPSKPKLDIPQSSPTSMTPGVPPTWKLIPNTLEIPPTPPVKPPIVPPSQPTSMTPGAPVSSQPIPSTLNVPPSPPPLDIPPSTGTGFGSDLPLPQEVPTTLPARPKVGIPPSSGTSMTPGSPIPKGPVPTTTGVGPSKPPIIPRASGTSMTPGAPVTKEPIPQTITIQAKGVGPTAKLKLTAEEAGVYTKLRSMGKTDAQIAEVLKMQRDLIKKLGNLTRKTKKK